MARACTSSSAVTRRAPSPPRLTATTSMPSATRSRAASRTSPRVGSGCPTSSASSSWLGLMRCGRAATAAAIGAPEESTATRMPRSRTRVTSAAYSVGGGAGRQAAAADDPVGAAGGVEGGVEQGVDLGRAEPGAGLVELGRGAVGLEDADVHPQGAGDGDAATGDAGGVEQLVHQVALGAARGQDGDGVGALGGERAGDVDALAAGVDPARAWPGAPRRGAARR